MNSIEDPNETSTAPSRAVLVLVGGVFFTLLGTLIITVMLSVSVWSAFLTALVIHATTILCGAVAESRQAKRA